MPMPDAAPTPTPSSPGPRPSAGPATPALVKYFSLGEATAALPYVSRVAVDIVELYEEVLELRHELEYLDEGELYNLTRQEYDTTMDRLGGLVDELHAVGAELRDFVSGRVHFPGTHLGRLVALVWEPGQPEITHYCDLDAVAPGLRPIGELLAA